MPAKLYFVIKFQYCWFIDDGSKSWLGENRNMLHCIHTESNQNKSGTFYGSQCRCVMLLNNHCQLISTADSSYCVCMCVVIEEHHSRKSGELSKDAEKLSDSTSRSLVVRSVNYARMQCR